MSEIALTLEQLRGMIGQVVYHQGVCCCVIEVLEDGPALVLQDRAAHTEIQNNQYGDPKRRVAQTYTVQVLSEDGQNWHPEFLGLELLEVDC